MMVMDVSGKEMKTNAEVDGHRQARLDREGIISQRGALRPCPHDTFANGSHPVARVHAGETGMLVPVSRDHLLELGRYHHFFDT